MIMSTPALEHFSTLKNQFFRKIANIAIILTKDVSYTEPPPHYMLRSPLKYLNFSS